MKGAWLLLTVAAAVVPPSPAPMAALAPSPAPFSVADVAPELDRTALRIKKSADEAERWAEKAEKAAEAFKPKEKTVSFAEEDWAKLLQGEALGKVAASAGQRAKEALWLNDVTSAGRLKRTVTFPVGDWFLGVGDGGLGRDKDNPAGGALIMKGSLADSNEDDRPPQWEMMTSETEEKAEGPGGDATRKPFSDEFKASHDPPKGGWTNSARAGVAALPQAGYGGELQLLEDFRSQTIHFSDLTDTSRFSCQHSAWGPGPGGPGPTPTLQGYPHPQIELDHPESFVHVHLEDRSAGPSPHVLWEAAYDLGGTEVLKATAPAMWGTRPNMELFCPPKHGPPHWYELTISREQNAKRRPEMMQDFIASQVISAYRPDQDPQLDAFSMDANADRVSFL